MKRLIKLLEDLIALLIKYFSAVPLEQTEESAPTEEPVPSESKEPEPESELEPVVEPEPIEDNEDVVTIDPNEEPMEEPIVDAVVEPVTEAIGTDISEVATHSLTQIDIIVDEILEGKWGSGDTRKQKLVEAGYDYDQVQGRVNDILKIVQEVLDGRWGTGDTRKQKLIAAGYSYDTVQRQINRQLSASENSQTINNMNAWAKKIAADNRYHYVTWKSCDVQTHKCPICSGISDAAHFGWNCIGFSWAVWHHGGGLANKCNCGVISNAVGEKILQAASDAEALSIVKSKCGLNDVTVIRNKNGIPKSQWKAGDICLKFNGDTYTHSFYYMGNGQIADSTGSNGKVANDKQIAIRSYDNYSAKVIIRWTGKQTVVKKSIDELAQEVLDGKWGSGDKRKANLEAAGYDYYVVQNRVNEIIAEREAEAERIAAEEAAAKLKAEYDALIEKLAYEVLDGKWGSGDNRKANLEAAGYNYYDVQSKVNEILENKTTAKYAGPLPSLTLTKTTSEVINDACKWAAWIAGDNSFHYGYTNKHGSSKSSDWSPNAHHNGCYFCNTNVTSGGRSKKGIVDYQKTYCCNPFVHAAFAHGGCDPTMLKKCRAGGSYVASNYKKDSNWKSLGKPAFSSLKKGDVLYWEKNGACHYALYLGNNKLAEASSGDDNVRGSARWKNSIHVRDIKSWGSFQCAFRYVGSVNVSTYLTHGEISNRVAQWQAFLDWFYDGQVGSADGIYGDNTFNWTKKFQEEQIGAGQGDGIIGNKTLEVAANIEK